MGKEKVTYNGKEYTWYDDRYFARGNKRLHRVVWEDNNRKIPKGYCVHHKDHDRRNNDISNLELFTNSEHMVKHNTYEKENFPQRFKERTIKAMDNARKYARIWHGSKNGREWHKEHGRDIWINRTPRKYTCTYCGDVFETKNIYGESKNSFCSNNCKSAYRRDSGVDNTIKVCEQCGTSFIHNKYQKKRFCCRKCFNIFSNSQH